MPLGLAPLRPEPLPGGVVAVLDRQIRKRRLLPRRECFIGFREFTDKQSHRIAVRHNVMDCQQEQVIFFRQTEQARAEQWAGGQVKRLAGFFDGKGAHPVLPFGRGESAEVRQRQRQR